MADVFAYLYGFGAGGDFTKSVIIVDNLPTGSTVTCTKGTVTKTAAERNGEWWFKGLEIGTWTLRAEKDGEKPVTQKFEITEFGVYRVHMSFFTATITAKYPAGSICTCSKGGEVLTAPDTSGSYTFTVESAGDWNISINDSSIQQSRTKVVSITNTGQSETISIDYIIWIIKDGVEVIPTTLYGSVTKSITDGYVVFKGKETGHHGAYAEVDLPKLMTLVIQGDFDTSEREVRLAIWKKSASVIPDSTNWTLRENITNNTELSMDVSDYSGAYYAGLTMTYTRTQRVSNLYLEPTLTATSNLYKQQLAELDAAYTEGVNSV